MPNKRIRVIRNSKKKDCQNCGGMHDYISRRSETAECGTPVAYGYDKGIKMSKIYANGPEDLEVVPDDTLVILDDSARKLPHAAKGVQLDQLAGEIIQHA